MGERAIALPGDQGPPPVHPAVGPHASSHPSLASPSPRRTGWRLKSKAGSSPSLGRRSTRPVAPSGVQGRLGQMENLKMSILSSSSSPSLHTDAGTGEHVRRGGERVRVDAGLEKEKEGLEYKISKEKEKQRGPKSAYLMERPSSLVSSSPSLHTDAGAGRGGDHGRGHHLPGGDSVLQGGELVRSDAGLEKEEVMIEIEINIEKQRGPKSTYRMERSSSQVMGRQNVEMKKPEPTAKHEEITIMKKKENIEEGRKKIEEEACSNICLTFKSNICTCRLSRDQSYLVDGEDVAAPVLEEAGTSPPPPQGLPEPVRIVLEEFGPPLCGRRQFPVSHTNGTLHAGKQQLLQCFNFRGTKTTEPAANERGTTAGSGSEQGKVGGNCGQQPGTRLDLD